MQDIPIVSVAQSLTPANDSTQLSLVAGLDLGQQDRRSREHLTVAWALFDRDGRIIKAQQQRLELLLKDATVQGPVNEVIAVKANFEVARGDYVIRLVVSDAERQMMSATDSKVVVRPPWYRRCL